MSEKKFVAVFEFFIESFVGQQSIQVCRSTRASRDEKRPIEEVAAVYPIADHGFNAAVAIPYSDNETYDAYLNGTLFIENIKPPANPASTFVFVQDGYGDQMTPIVPQNFQAMEYPRILVGTNLGGLKDLKDGDVDPVTGETVHLDADGYPTGIFAFDMSSNG